MTPSTIFQRTHFFDTLKSSDHPALLRWAEHLENVCRQRYFDRDDKLLTSWRTLLAEMPPINDAVLDATGDTIKIDGVVDDPELLKQQLLTLNPWRVGPWKIAGIDVDTEWRSFMKWNRIASEVYFDNAKVLDVGCNNGYFGFKALAAGAAWVLGVEPFLLYNAQHEVFRQYCTDESAIGVMPITDDEVPRGLGVFDVALSMGVLYHRKDPIGHLEMLQGSLRKRGQLILETMAIDSLETDVIVPEGKFAKMRGVWFMPTVGMLQRWLRRTGFADIKVLDVSVTDSSEQRRTEFMPFESLSDFLDPNDPERTIEGYPRPTRVVISALKAG